MAALKCKNIAASLDDLAAGGSDVLAQAGQLGARMNATKNSMSPKAGACPSSADLRSHKQAQSGPDAR
jgi:hypothetical protein